jgi:acetylglutamate kinase
MNEIKHINVVKIGGNVIDNAEVLSRFLDDFVKLPAPKVLVHGGGKEATRLSQTLQIETKMINGRRVTDRQTLDVVTMVYAGLINKRIVAALQGRGCNAIGLTGADGNVIPATRRSPEPIDFGFVGDIDAAKVNDAFIKTLLQSGIVPVFCAIEHDGNGSLLNCNADSVASAVAVASARIAEVDMHYCFEKDGVLVDIDDPNSLVSEITPGRYAELKEQGIINKGMIPKVDNAFNAVNGGVSRVIIKNSDNLLSDRGTVIKI